jgi:hypothetical protein
MQAVDPASARGPCPAAFVGASPSVPSLTRPFAEIVHVVRRNRPDDGRETRGTRPQGKHAPRLKYRCGKGEVVIVNHEGRGWERLEGLDLDLVQYRSARLGLLTEYTLAARQSARSRRDG